MSENDRRIYRISRRDFGRLALASVPAAALMGSARELLAFAGKPDSKINGVQVGTITYSFRSMPDQSAEATLGYTVQSGISAIELMSGPTWDYAYKKTGITPPNAARGAGAAGRGTGAAGAAPAGAAQASAEEGSWEGNPCTVAAGRGG